MKNTQSKRNRYCVSLTIWSLMAVAIVMLAMEGVVAQSDAAGSSIVVRIDPRLKPGSVNGTGKATVSLLDENGNILISFDASSPGALAAGVKGPRRNIKSGDTPFGVYRFTTTAGGLATSRLGTGYGTGKIYLDDADIFGEAFDSDPKRSLIRFHGGGTALIKEGKDPYAANQSLRRTLGCVRMKNNDVNTLIHVIETLPANRRLKYVYMGDNNYLNSLANNSQLSAQPWWRALRVVQHLPLSQTIVTIRLDRGSLPSTQASCQAISDPQDEVLKQCVRVFAEDVDTEGINALNQFRNRIDALESMRSSLPADDGLRPQIAFALCYLGEDCTAGVTTLIDSLENPRRYRGFYADQAQMMISRLIDKKRAAGEEVVAHTLMAALFVQALTSDGALSEGLGATFGEKLRTQTRFFMDALERFFLSSTSAVWARVMQLAKDVGSIRPQDLNKALTYKWKSSAFRKAFKDYVAKHSHNS